MPNNFPTLERINLLFHHINAFEDVSSLKYISKLLNDLTGLLNESNFYDVEIKVGTGQDAKTFRAHSAFLKARSSYFNAALSKNWIKRSEDESVILFKKENVSPRVFEVLLT